MSVTRNPELAARVVLARLIAADFANDAYHKRRPDWRALAFSLHTALTRLLSALGADVDPLPDGVALISGSTTSLLIEALADAASYRAQDSDHVRVMFYRALSRELEPVKPPGRGA